MKRTVLYYPAIAIPDGPWLRRALFYFDEVASIVPSKVSWDGEVGESFVPIPIDVKYLESEKVFRRMAPDNLWLKGPNATEDWSRADAFAKAFLEALDRLQYHSVPNGRTQRVHRGKMAEFTLAQLLQRGLVSFEGDPQKAYQEWFLVEANTARLYMAMLAQHMADLDMEFTVPGTDSIEDEDIIYKAPVGDGFPCVETRFHRVIPVPRDDVSLSDILNFKQRRETELLAYREKLDELQGTLSEADSHGALKHALVRFEEGQRRELANLTAAMADSGIATFFGSLKTLVKTSKPALWGAAAAVVAPAAPEASVAFAGLAVAGVVESGAYFVDRRNEKRANERKSAFAYLQHAKEEHII
jgi:hypothetical protein